MDCGLYFPDLESNLGLLHWELGGLAPGLPGKTCLTLLTGLPGGLSRSIHSCYVYCPPAKGDWIDICKF